MQIKEKIIKLLEKIDDYDVLTFVLVIIEDALQWQQDTGV